MKNTMKQLVNNGVVDIFEFNNSKKDIVEIILIENAKIMNKKTKDKYFNSTFLKITNRKGEFRILDLMSSLDITNIFENFELSYSKKTKEKPIFIGQ